MNDYTNTTAADLLALLKRAEHKEREATKTAGAESLAEMMKADEERRMRTTFGTGSDAERDRLRSEGDRLTHNDLELRRSLGDTLSDEEEAERAALAARRTSSGWYAPAEAPE